MIRQIRQANRSNQDYSDNENSCLPDSQSMWRIQKKSRDLGHRLKDLQQQLKDLPTLKEIDDLHARLAEVEARLELLINHREVLQRAEHSLEQVVVRLRQHRLPRALEIASPWLRRLTKGNCVRIFADATRTELLIETTTSIPPLQIRELTRGAQHQLALVLRLALLEVHSTTSERMPANHRRRIYYFQ